LRSAGVIDEMIARWRLNIFSSRYHEQALRAAEKMRKGKFDLDDLSMQLAQMEKMGGIEMIARWRLNIFSSRLAPSTCFLIWPIPGSMPIRVEKAAETIDHEQALRAAEKMRKGKFDLDDLSMQLAQMVRLATRSGWNSSRASTFSPVPTSLIGLPVTARIDTIDHEQALRAAEKMRKGKFDLDDLSMQLAQMEKHAEDAVGDAVGVELLEGVDLLAGADELDRLAGDG
jgi:phage gp16-like protein